jgi:hyperosmotically inducible periplasmic protein
MDLSMNAKTVLPCMGVLLVSLTGYVAAQDDADKARPAVRADQRYELGGGHVALASKLIGMEVRDAAREKVGKIDELAVDLGSGRIVQVILSTGFLGRNVAVPPSAFTCRADPKDPRDPWVEYRLDKAQLKNAPEFHTSKWDEQFESNRVVEAYGYYNARPYFTESGELKQMPPKYEDKTTYRHTNYWSSLGRVDKASKVIGMSVKNAQDESVGKVDDLLVDLPDGRVVQVVVATGGFLGLGEAHHAIPPSAFRVDRERNHLFADLSKDALKSAPRYETAATIRPVDRTADLETYRYYKVEPYFNTDADNTRRNVRDRDGTTLTPFDQGSSESDIETTRSIRKAFRDHDTLSTTAQNVKIITRDGKVTLRGPVKTEQEKTLLGDVAGKIATPEKVDNQLEVKKAVGEP